MAKTSAPTLPTVADQRALPLAAGDDSPPPAKSAATSTAAAPPTTTPAPATAPPPEIVERPVVVPLLELGQGYIRRRVDVALTRAQGGKLRALELALTSRGERLANGKIVANQGDALRWILERLAD